MKMCEVPMAAAAVKDLVAANLFVSLSFPVRSAEFGDVLSQDVRKLRGLGRWLPKMRPRFSARSSGALK
jgi:hypothetical protein